MPEQVETQSKESTEKFFLNEKYWFTNLFGDLISYFLIFVVILGSLHMYNSLDELMFEIKQANTTYKYPIYSDLLPSILYTVILIVGHEVFQRLFSDKMEQHLHPRYFEDKNESYLIEIYRKKVATNIYKFAFYLCSTLFGFYVLKNLEFFPWSLLGQGEFKNLFKPYPEVFYFEKPENFDFYYNLNLSFALFDGYLLLSNPLQSDFLLMILHHLATYSLITFSFVSNLSNIGSIVYYSHYLGDVFSYIVRVGIHLNVPDYFTFVTTFIFLIVFSYTRLFVFGDIIYQIYYGLNYKWTIIERNLTGFLCVLMILNVLWIVLITKKLLKYCFTGNIEEIYKFKIKKK